MKYYCKKCNFEFSDKFSKRDASGNLLCPKCNNRVDAYSKKPGPTITKVDKVASKALNIYFDIYIILSIIAVISYFLNLNIVVIIASIIMSIVFLIELLFGFTRNYFGIGGYILSIVLGIYFIKEPLLGFAVGTSFMFLIASIIRLIRRGIIKIIYKFFG